MTRAAALWILLALFTGRVLGQLAVALDVAPFLPPMDEWQSGLLPYPVLLAAQVVLLAGLGTICWQFSRGRGWFVRGPAGWARRYGSPAGSTRRRWLCATPSGWRSGPRSDGPVT